MDCQYLSFIRNAFSLGFFGNSLIQTVHPMLRCKSTAGKTAAQAGSDLGLPLARYQRALQRMVGEMLTKWKLL